MYKLGLLLINFFILSYPLSAILTHYQLHGGHQTPSQHLRAVLAPYLTLNYYQLDRSALEAAVLQLPWVKSLNLQRRLTSPFTLHITIKEQTPLCLWGGDSTLLSQYQVLSTDGQALSIPATDPYLEYWKTAHHPPVLQGRLPQIHTIYAHYVQQLQGSFLTIQRVHCPTPTHCQLQLNKGYILHHNPQKNPKALEQFAKIAPQLSESPPIHIDLRHRQGIAVTNQPQ